MINDYAGEISNVEAIAGQQSETTLELKLLKTIPVLVAMYSEL